MRIWKYKNDWMASCAKFYKRVSVLCDSKLCIFALTQRRVEQSCMNMAACCETAQRRVVWSCVRTTACCSKLCKCDRFFLQNFLSARRVIFRRCVDWQHGGVLVFRNAFLIFCKRPYHDTILSWKIINISWLIQTLYQTISSKLTVQSKTTCRESNLTMLKNHYCISKTCCLNVINY